MSRFFASDSELSDDDFFNVVEESLFQETAFSSDEFTENEESDLSASEGEKLESQPQAAPLKKSRFFDVSDSDSDEDSAPRAIMSQKSRALAEVTASCTQIEAFVGEDKWNQISNRILFDEICRKVEKGALFGIPKSFLDLIKSLEVSINDVSAEGRKAMDATDSKAFNAMRQKVKKMLPTYEEHFKLGDTGEEYVRLGRSVEEMAGVSLKSSSKALEDFNIASVDGSNFLKVLSDLSSSVFRKKSDKTDFLVNLRSLYESASTDEHAIQALLIYLQHLMSALPVGDFLGELSECQKLLYRLLVLIASYDAQADACAALGFPDRPACIDFFLALLLKYDENFFSVIQVVDFHTAEYIELLRLERKFSEFLLSMLKSIESIMSVQQRCQLKLKILEHFYAKPQAVVGGAKVDFFGFIEEITRHGDSTIKARAGCYFVFMKSVLGSLQEARQRLRCSDIQDNVLEADVPTQILYNRSLAQYGLASFYCGNFREAYLSLQEICSSGRPKELLAQNSERTAEMAKIEKTWLLPHYMHLNIELIDCAFLLSSAFLEIPQNIAAVKFCIAEKKLFNSRHLKRLSDAHERNIFEGKPENSRELVIASAQELVKGNWQRSYDVVSAMKIFRAVPAYEAWLKIIEQYTYETIKSLGNLKTLVF